MCCNQLYSCCLFLFLSAIITSIHVCPCVITFTFNLLHNYIYLTWFHEYVIGWLALLLRVRLPEIQSEISAAPHKTADKHWRMNSLSNQSEMWMGELASIEVTQYKRIHKYVMFAVSACCITDKGKERAAWRIDRKNCFHLVNYYHYNTLCWWNWSFPQSRCDCLSENDLV